MLKNIDLLEFAIKRLNIKYDVPFRIDNSPAIYKICKEIKGTKVNINLLFLNEFTNGKYIKDRESKLFAILFDEHINVHYRGNNLDWIK